MQLRKESHPVTEAFLLVSSKDSKLQKTFPLKFPIGTCYGSPSGKYVAYLEQRRTPDYRSELHLWVKDLESGEEKELFANRVLQSTESGELPIHAASSHSSLLFAMRVRT